MRLLLTRPEEDAARTAAALEALGHEVILAPLMTIAFCDGPPLALDAVQALLITSANGVRALARRTARRDLPVFAVGAQSAAAAAAAGFCHIRAADGDVEALAKAVVGWADPHGGPLFYAAARDIRVDLAALLAPSGFTVRQEVLYAAVPAERLPAEAISALATGRADGVLLYSPRSAALFMAAVQQAGLADACAGLTAYCLSPAVAAALAGLKCGGYAIAPNPDQASLLALLRRDGL